ncbi:type VII secretion system-associated protein [Lentzea cavernae]|uniref:SseB protein N-terminal domain-containing protein n=1 Tax=Lentzea cavernae TaxID=2020703 RepID=A0ABQ3MZW8_9PSEU|nr:type VII secretion system-associated protein [Lentzea cavernae]GHH56458.1 hypothetical protein GCM10017774_74540 [Lentzea cavernae]
MTEQVADENWLLLMDPAWQPSEEDEAPPLHAVVGLWPVEEDGAVGRFRANPDYRPVDADSPSDPIDAGLRLVLRGDAEIGQVQALLRDSLVDVAMNGDGRPLVLKSPDEIPCVVVCTSEPHRARMFAPDWQRTDLAEVVALLADGVDALINPGGPASVRLSGDFLRETANLTEEEARQLLKTDVHPAGLRMDTWAG